MPNIAINKKNPNRKTATYQRLSRDKTVNTRLNSWGNIAVNPPTRPIGRYYKCVIVLLKLYPETTKPPMCVGVNYVSSFRRQARRPPPVTGSPAPSGQPARPHSLR